MGFNFRIPTEKRALSHKKGRIHCVITEMVASQENYLKLLLNYGILRTVSHIRILNDK
jgi:hypothetical protein